jgi:hypothetical protein
LACAVLLMVWFGAACADLDPKSNCERLNLLCEQRDGYQTVDCDHERSIYYALSETDKEVLDRVFACVERAVDCDTAELCYRAPDGPGTLPGQTAAKSMLPQDPR